MPKNDTRTALVTNGNLTQDNDGKDVLVYPTADTSKPIKSGFANVNGQTAR